MPEVKVQLPVGLCPGLFAHAGARPQHPVTFAFVLREGRHVFRSEDLLLGRLHNGRKVLGQVAFDYEYVAEAHEISLFGSTHGRSGSLWIDAAIEQDSGYRTVTVAENHLPPASDQDAPVIGALQKVAHLASRSLLSALEATPDLTAWTPLVPAGPSLSGILVVYRAGRLLELFDAGRVYGPTDRIVHIESTGAQRATLPPNTKLRNVIGSTTDPKIRSRPWLALWRLMAQPPGINLVRSRNTPNPGCASSGLPRGIGQPPPPFACSARLVGGHVVNFRRPQRQPAGSTSVMIVPICSRHNAKPGVLLTMRVRTPAIRLQGYLQ
jgi:hypothetical protein